MRGSPISQDKELKEVFYMLKKNIKYILTPEQMTDFEMREEAAIIGISNLAQKKYQEGELNGRIAGAKAYKDTLQSRMTSAYENNVTIKEMEDWFDSWKEGQSQLEKEEQ